jgi:hypothetical protein
MRWFSILRVASFLKGRKKYLLEFFGVLSVALPALPISTPAQGWISFLSFLGLATWWLDLG